MSIKYHADKDKLCTIYKNRNQEKKDSEKEKRRKRKILCKEKISTCDSQRQGDSRVPCPRVLLGAVAIILQLQNKY